MVCVCMSEIAWFAGFSACTLVGWIAEKCVFHLIPMSMWVCTLFLCCCAQNKQAEGITPHNNKKGQGWVLRTSETSHTV